MRAWWPGPAASTMGGMQPVEHVPLDPAGDPADDPAVDAAVRAYVAAIPGHHRALYDRVHRLVLEAHPRATAAMSYAMPSYVVGGSRLHVGAWKHGLSFYGWSEARDAGFAARHPELVGSKGTIRLDPDAAAGIDDDELRDFFHATLSG